MKKVILHVNSFLCGSTGNIMLSIARTAENFEIKSLIAYPSSRTNNRININNSIKIGNILDRNIHLLKAYYSGYNGCYSYYVTKKFLKQVEQIKPDIIHLHNLHNCYINLDMLFKYIKNKNIPVIWTLHDCWAFTGQCPHYTVAKCNKWKTGCFDCPEYRQYPSSRVDKTKEMYINKKNWFTGVKNLTIVTPSEWLRNQVNESFLGEYPTKVINNGIDLSIFKPTNSNFKKKHDLLDKIILLGVASPWNTKKGLDIFIELSKALKPLYKIVLVGLTNKQIEQLPENTLGLPRTSSKEDLAMIYTAADIFINPTLEDTFPTTNLESIACGTPIITFNTGGSVEVINKYTGRVVKNNNTEELINIIDEIMAEHKVKYSKNIIEQSKKYNEVESFNQYIELYKSMMGDFCG